MKSNVLRIADNVLALPVVHGSADCATEVRRIMLQHDFDCVAVPLPASFQDAVEDAIGTLPTAGVVMQREVPVFDTSWSPGGNDPDIDDQDLDANEMGDGEAGHEDEHDLGAMSYVPIDPCQPVIVALRIAIGEHVRRAFIDLETNSFEPQTSFMPDAYALKTVSLERFASAVLPSVPPPANGQPRARINFMAHRLQELSRKYRSILLVCSILDWPWIRDAFQNGPAQIPEHDFVDEPQYAPVDPRTLVFMLGELPFITGCYEQARLELDDDTHLSIDGVKALLLTARERYYQDFGQRARRITPQLLRQCVKYIRNLSLMRRRMTPDLYTIVVAAKQVCGDSYAVHVAETARDYPFLPSVDDDCIHMGIDRARVPDGDILLAKNRLPGPAMEWRSVRLTRRPDKDEQERWQMKWNPMSQCSWPPEDDLIENFRSHVMERAKQIMGADLIRTEKFTTSVRDGIDVRDTLRNWHTGDLYVKVLPPSRGSLDAVVMLFESPADPRDYPWRATWFAEHSEESTLAFFATDFRSEMIGPGIGVATYGGALFLYPPIGIIDIWNDPRLDFAETLEERLLAAACLHSRNPQIALLSALPPGAGWRRLARRFKKRWVHVPLGQFSDSTVQQLRMVHVLNGREVRSYASHFIRKA